MLTDIIGSEDHFGDMDFKLCGTAAGITGFQLDLKLPGISLKLMDEAIYRTRDARFKVLEVMNAALAAPRTEMSQYAPRIETIRINPDKIGLLIGPGGKTIKGIVAETGARSTSRTTAPCTSTPTTATAWNAPRRSSTA